jgi:ubiquinone/menaquinone biosynthesis C-methylase UbiE
MPEPGRASRRLHAVEAYDSSEARKVVDVGGGQGAVMAALLHAHSHLDATIFDRSAPTAETQKRFSRCEIGGRANFIQGDFFTVVPQGGDLYVLKSVIHNWDDAAAARILEKLPPCYAVRWERSRRRACDPGRERTFGGKAL